MFGGQRAEGRRGGSSGGDGQSGSRKAEGVREAVGEVDHRGRREFEGGGQSGSRRAEGVAEG